MEWWNAVLPVVTLALGWLLSVATEERRAKKEIDRVREERRANHSEVRADRREDFELETLRNLYKALNRFARSCSRFHLIDLEAAHSSGKPYGAVRVPESDDLAEEVRVDFVSVRELAGLVLDDAIRMGVLEASVALHNLPLSSKSIDQAKGDYDAAIQLVGLAQEALSGRIREIYLDEG
jgi:hypothetical protein